MKRRKVIAVSGARSDYDLLYSVYKMLDDDDRFEFEVVITGPHLSEKFGYTAHYIEQDGFTIGDRILNLLDSDTKAGRIVSIGNQIPGLVQTFNRLKPDIILVAGDREEAISVTMTAAYMDIPVAHFFGGDIAKDGNIDNSTRYAASKYAHLHFPTLEQHKETLLRLGEDEWRIFVVGNPALDRFLATEAYTKEKLYSRLKVDTAFEPYCVLIQHSIITQVEEQAEHIRITLEALVKSGIRCFINYPNSDAGSSAIIEAYQLYAQKYPDQFRLFQNLERTTYINLLRHAQFLIGNSSSGIVEVASLGLAAINIGTRQRGRVHGNNVIFVDNVESQILAAIQTVLSDETFREQVRKKDNPYGSGDSAKKVVEILANLTIDDNLIYKNISY